MDDAARDQLVLGVLPWCHSLAIRLVDRPQDRDDAVQELALKLLKGAKTFDPKRGQATTWTAAIAFRLLRPSSRNELPTKPLPFKLRDPKQRLAEDVHDDAEQCEKVKAVLAMLPPADAEMIRRVVLDGVPVAGLDRGQSRERCRQRYQRALSRARRLMEPRP